jgi:predicted nucleotidyltransferase
MPVRSSSSPVLVWPSREQVVAAARGYAERLVAADARVLRVALVGSYATGNHGPGSDADLLVEMSECQTPPTRRALELPPPRLPVPVDLLVFTRGEVDELQRTRPRWTREVLQSALWLADRDVPGHDAAE